jgi:hypothetical protein
MKRNCDVTSFVKKCMKLGFEFCGKGPRSRCYGRTAALMLIVQPYDEDEQFFFILISNGVPVE